LVKEELGKIVGAQMTVSAEMHFRRSKTPGMMRVVDIGWSGTVARARRKNAGRGVSAAGVARKWEGERRRLRTHGIGRAPQSVRPPNGRPPERVVGMRCLTKRMYDWGRGEASGELRDAYCVMRTAYCVLRTA
jgi:hypothetical protein